MSYKNVKELERKTEDIVILCTGASVNEMNDRQWEWIMSHYTMALNNFVYHPFIVPSYCHMEIKSYDFPYQQKYLNDKWSMGWGDVGFIYPNERADFMTKCIGHSEAKIYTYDFKARGEHPKKNPNVIINADYNPDTTIYKSYDASMTSVIQLVYMMGYKNIFILGMDMLSSEYFWSDMNIQVHDRWNKEREGKSMDKPHNASHLKNFVIDFNARHMLPKGREIFVLNRTTALYPALRYHKI